MEMFKSIAAHWRGGVACIVDVLGSLPSRSFVAMFMMYFLFLNYFRPCIHLVFFAVMGIKPPAAFAVVNVHVGYIHLVRFVTSAWAIDQQLSRQHCYINSSYPISFCEPVRL